MYVIIKIRHQNTCKFNNKTDLPKSVIRKYKRLTVGLDFLKKVRNEFYLDSGPPCVDCKADSLTTDSLDWSLYGHHLISVGV